MSANKDWLRELHCEPRRWFSSAWVAEAQAQELFRETGRTHHAFECWFCQGWHLRELKPGKDAASPHASNFDWAGDVRPW